ncbi:peptidyl-prolyl cis-trans isomerase [Candidatus Dependentiae bacterium]
MIIEMRRKLKKIRWVWYFVALAMALPAGGGLFMAFWKDSDGSGKRIGKVNGLPISEFHYRHTMIREQMYRSQLAQYGFAHLAAKIEPESVIRSCAEDALLDQIADNLLLTVGEEELQAVLEQGLAGQAVRGDGKVDMNAYRQMVASTFHTDVDTYERELKGEIKRNTLREIIKQGSYSPKYAFDFDTDQKTAKKKFEILSMPFSHFEKKVEKGGIKEKELKSFYDKRKSKYMSPETRKVRVAHIKEFAFSGKSSVSEYDITEHYNRYAGTKYSTPAKFKIRVIFTQIKKDTSKKEFNFIHAIFDDITETMREEGQKADLRKVAKKEADEAGLKVQVGVSGYFELGKDIYPKKVENAVGWMQSKGDVSPIIKTDEAFYLVQLEDKQLPEIKPFDSVKGEIRALLEKRMSGYKLRSEVELFMRSCYDNPDNFDDFIKKHNLKVTTESYTEAERKLLSEHKEKGGFIKAIFSWNRSVPYVGYVPEEGGYTLFSIDEIVKPKIRPFKEVKDVVKKAYVESRTKRLARETASKLHEKLLAKKTTFKALSEKDGFSLITTQLLTPESTIKSPENAGNLVLRAFEITDKSQVLKHDNDKDYFMVRLIGRENGKKDPKKKVDDKIEDPFLGVATLQGFIASMLQDAKIETESGVLDRPVSDDDYSDY